MRDPNSNIPGRWFVLASLALMVACNEGGPTVGLGAQDGGIVGRGRYLVSHVAGCIDCHSPRGKDGSFVEKLWLSGVDCLIDVAPGDPTSGCVAAPNLTDDETGLKNRSDQEIKDMFLRGERPDGKALHPIMPYWMYGNMHESDADAIVAYLRTVKGVGHMVAASQAPFLAPERAAPRVPDSMIPMPRADYTNRAAALRGRYLAGAVAGCVDCHARYQQSPESAWATHLAWTETSGAEAADPYRGAVHMSLADRELAYALDDGVGGPHDQPAPGELLCAALAACVDSTIRLAAARMRVDIERLAVIVTGDVDSRGSLGDDGVPVGFQSMRLEIQLQLGARSHPGAAEKLLAAAERYSEVLQTLRSPMPTEIVDARASGAPPVAGPTGHGLGPASPSAG